MGSGAGTDYRDAAGVAVSVKVTPVEEKRRQVVHKPEIDGKVVIHHSGQPRTNSPSRSKLSIHPVIRSLPIIG